MAEPKLSDYGLSKAEQQAAQIIEAWIDQISQNLGAYIGIAVWVLLIIFPATLLHWNSNALAWTLILGIPIGLLVSFVATSAITRSMKSTIPNYEALTEFRAALKSYRYEKMMGRYRSVQKDTTEV